MLRRFGFECIPIQCARVSGTGIWNGCKKQKPKRFTGPSHFVFECDGGSLVCRVARDRATDDDRQNILLGVLLEAVLMPQENEVWVVSCARVLTFPRVRSKGV